MVNVLKEDFEYISSKVDFSKLNGSEISIFGAKGFLGFNFIENLKRFDGDYHAVALDWGPYGQALLGYPSLNPKIYIHEADLTTCKTFDYGQDYIIYLASKASPVAYRDDPIGTADVNTIGLKNVLEFYKEQPIKSFLYFSTSEIYGDPTPDNIPIPETYRGNVATMGPRACYDESKRYAETLCYMYHQKYNMPIKIVRPFNNYGPGMSINDGRLPADLAKAVLANKDMVLHSNGSPSRTFCYVADAMIGYWKALFYDKFDVFNIGIDYPEIKTGTFAGNFQFVAEQFFNYNGKIIHEKSKDKDYLVHSPQRRCPDISKAKKLLKYYPKIPPRIGIYKYLTHLKETQK